MPGKFVGVALDIVFPEVVLKVTESKLVMFAPAKLDSTDRPNRSFSPMPSRATVPVMFDRVVVLDPPPYPYN
jgi:hypothetical protein